MEELVWYCSYGSNLSLERFNLYLFGGASPLVDRVYPGCTDKTKPRNDISYEIPYELYFAKEADFWEGMAVAFINDKKSDVCKTYSRMYLITKKQFDEIVQQENNPFGNRNEFSIDIEELKKKGSLLLGSDDENRFYGKVLFVGMHESAPVVTFTSKWSMGDVPFKKPGERYLKTIIGGIREKRKMPKERLLEYFNKINGIKSYYSEKKLLKIIDEVILNEPIEMEVQGTGKINRHGEFFVQVSSNTFMNDIKPKYALIKRMDRLCEIQARVEYIEDQNGDKQIINLDQQLRCALAAEKGDKVLVYPINYSDKKYIKNRDSIYRKIVDRLFGIQFNMVRVRRASYNDMEINVCRLRSESFHIIGVEPGDVVVIESPYYRFRTHALEITDTIEKEFGERLEPANNVDLDSEKLLGTYRIENNKVDINPILMDYDARNSLKIRQCAPLRIRRSILFEIRKRLHYIATPIILTILATVASFPSLSDYTKVIMLTVGALFVILLTFVNIKMKV